MTCIVAPKISSYVFELLKREVIVASLNNIHLKYTMNGEFLNLPISSSTSENQLLCFQYLCCNACKGGGTKRCYIHLSRVRYRDWQGEVYTQRSDPVKMLKRDSLEIEHFLLISCGK